jgi:hypothetical protein
LQVREKVVERLGVYGNVLTTNLCGKRKVVDVAAAFGCDLFPES